MARRTRPLQDRFWEKVTIPADKSKCWVWTGATGNYGYGVIGKGGRGEGNARAHVLSWEWANGRKVPAGMVVCHQCDNTACVNPTHLHVASQKENMREAVERNRGLGKGKVPWQNNKAAKLNPEAVLKIRELAAGGATQRAIASSMGLTCHNTIGRVLRGENWNHVKEAQHVI